MVSAKEKLLVGVGAAITAGCQPCVTSLVQAARKAGACERSIRLAIEVGLAVRASATEAMARWAAAEQGQVPALDETFRLEKEKLAALVSAGATFAARSTATLDSQLLNAQAYDWANAQIAEALAVASAVAKTATEKVECAAASVGFSVGKLDSSCCRDLQAPAIPAAVQGGCECAGNIPGT